MVDDDSEASEVFTLKKSNLSRQAIEKNALRKSALAASLSSDHIPFRQIEERPSYSRDHLDELKNATPSTPKKYTEPGKALDVASKFGTDSITYQDGERNSAIPTDAEIMEKKARRARLAKEQKYKSHDSNSSSDEDKHDEMEERSSDDDEFRNQNDSISLATSSRNKHAPTRLVADDEDIMEDFDSFVEDGRITLGKKAEREQRQKKKEEMRDLIAQAEGGSTEGDSDDSERERREEYEASQTRKGMEGLQVIDQSKSARSKTPPKITPLPALASCLERLRATLTKMELERAQKVRKMEEISIEKQSIAEREIDIQRLLAETGERYEKLSAEAGMETNGHGTIEDSMSQRGLESMGATPLRVMESVTD
jgi:hypothetical protein